MNDTEQAIADLNKIDTGDGPEPKPNTGPGPQPGQSAPEAGEFIPGDDLGAGFNDVSTAQVLEMLGGPLAELLCPNWELKPQEISQLANVYGELIDKYFPSLNLGVEVNAALITLIVFAPRKGTPPRIKDVTPTPGGDEVEKENGDKSQHQPKK